MNTLTTVRTYMGCHIYPVTRPTTWGARWETYVGGRFVMADTLAGIRSIIRHEMRPDLPYGEGSR